MISDEELFDVIRVAAETSPLCEGAIPFNAICREVKNRYGRFNAEGIEFRIRHFNEVGVLKAAFLDGMLIGVKPL